VAKLIVLLPLTPEEGEIPLIGSDQEVPIPRRLPASDKGILPHSAGAELGYPGTDIQNYQAEGL
jgi:hypothetical protein